MIAYFPTIYPDELLYSQLARYFTKSGYMAYTFAAEDLFISKTVRPDIEFVNAYTPAAVEAITRGMPMEEVIEKHTVFPYYGRFFAKGTQKKSISGSGIHNRELPQPPADPQNQKRSRQVFALLSSLRSE